MSFRINTNVDAMNATRNLSASSAAMSKSITRLSTGLRINSAADDPSGLIASEKFRSQIGGLSQAIKNSQDAINYAKTAEGSLDEVNSLLNDARTLAVAAGNSATLSSSQIQANQAQLASIVSSITRISSTTQYGTKKLLDGSSGVQAAVTDSAKVAALNIGGTFGGSAITANATVTLTSITAGTQASLTGAAFATVGSAVASAGSFTLNGVTFSATAATTGQQVMDMVNQAQGQTGVVATYSGGAVVFNTTAYGTNAKINLVDANGVVRAGGAGSSSAAGTDATASVTITTAAGATSVAFTASQNGNGGLTLSDTDGNTLTLTSAGNTTSAVAAAVGQVLAGSGTFQIGAGSGQTASLSLGNFAATQLGSGAVTGKNMSNIDLTTAANAANALLVIDKAIDEVSRSRGAIGNFQRNVLESNVRSLGVAKENLSATESSIRDTDVAEEMTQFTKQQILQQAGMSVLAQANQAPQNVLSLLR